MLALCTGAFFIGCNPSEEELRVKLEKVAKQDLEDIFEDLKTRGIDSLAADSGRHEIAHFRIFTGDTARVFSGMATVNYYYLRKNNFYQERKYRYRTTSKFWDRYEIKLKHNYAESDTSNTDSTVAQ